jgi:hypothetical protein
MKGKEPSCNPKITLKRGKKWVVREEERLLVFGIKKMNCYACISSSDFFFLGVAVDASSNILMVFQDDIK